jgi:hypothetical protein
MSRDDWKAADEEERRKFEELQKFTSKCREIWPGSKIVIRASDSACVDLNQRTSEMKTTDFYSDSSKYLRASDLIGKDRNATIAGVTRGEFTSDTGAKTVKPVVEFQDSSQALVLNKTNLAALEMMFGTDMDRWVGQTTRLYGDRVPFRGKIVDTIRISRPKVVNAPGSFDDDIDF